MRDRTLIAALAALLLVPAAAAAAVGPTRGEETPPTAAPVDGQLSDAEIVGVIDAANQSEIDAAQAAEGKSENADVESYARQMSTDHSEARERVSALGIEPVESRFSRDVKDRSRAFSNRLNRLEGEGYDRAYLSHQVQMHSDLLGLLDRRLIPQASDRALRDSLRELRAKVAAHLEQARRIEGTLRRR